MGSNVSTAQSGAPRPRASLSIDPLRLTWALVCCAFTVLFIWLMVADDPLGGEPVAMLSIPPVGEQQAAEAASGELDFREGLNPEDNVEFTPVVVEDETLEPQDIGPDPLDQQFDEMLAQGGTAVTRLVTAPVDGLTEPSANGLLPRISNSGQTPAKVYARPPIGPQAESNTAKVAIMIGGMGLSPSSTTLAINTLPAEVTLAFAPYANGIQRLADTARQNGHETMLQLPMEPFDYPDNDPGPHTLLTGLAPPENVRRLEWLLGRFTGYFGVTNYMGARYTSMPDSLRHALEQINLRGLVYVEDGSSARSQSERVARQIGLQATKADLLIDAIPSAAAIDAALQELEKQALESGVALGVASGLPVTIERIAAWARNLERKGVYLVPVSSTIALRQNLS